MGKYILKRLGLGFITLVLILSITFILVKMLPYARPIGGDQQQIAYFEKQYSLGYVYRFDYAKDEAEFGEPLYVSPVQNGKANYYYNIPALKQYANWVKNIVTKWDWGYSKSYQPNVSASVIIRSRIWVSLRLSLIASIISIPFGILLGIWAALKKNTATDHTISVLVMVGISIPSFILITFLLRIFAYKLGWLPSTWPTDSAAFGTKFKGYIIPVVSLCFGRICSYCRQVRAELCEVLASEYLLLARTKGLTRRQAIVRHALKNAMVPIFPSILAAFISIFTGSMILETLYSIPGLGRLYLSAITLKDWDLMFVDMAITTAYGMICGIFLDLSYGWIDPRIRMGAKK